jgi:hypothetical protein
MREREELWALAKQKPSRTSYYKRTNSTPSADWAEIWGREKVDLCWGWIACPQIAEGHSDNTPKVGKMQFSQNFEYTRFHTKT